MKIFALALPFLQLSTALFEDEAGQTDFTISTAGHGIIGATYAQITSDQRSVLTSSSCPYGTPLSISKSSFGSDGVSKITSASVNSVGCYVSSRSLKDGSLSWRRDVCSASTASAQDLDQTDIRHAVYSILGDETFYTLENNGMFRVWNDTNGAMTGEFPLEMNELVLSHGVPRLVSFDKKNMGAILSTAETEVLVVANEKGYQNLIVSASDVLRKANVKPTKNEHGSPVPSIFGVLSLPEGSKFLVTGWAHEGLKTSFAEMALVEISLNGGDVEVSKDYKGLPHGSKEALLLSSIYMDNEDIFANLFEEDEVVKYSYSKKSEERNGVGISIQCESMTINNKSLDIGTSSPISSMHKLQCTQFFVTVLASTKSGGTHVFTLKKGKGANMLWTAEEGLANAASAIFLDNGAAQIENSDDDEAKIIASLSLSSRLNSQMEILSSFVSGGFVDRIWELFGGSSGAGSNKDEFFGLNKIAVILSNNFDKVFGIDTATKGSIEWTLNLNKEATWHKVVYGAASSRSSALGQGKHHPHSSEILILSHAGNKMEWKCVDGLRGKVISEAAINISSTVAQVIPVHGHSHANGGCKQNVMLVLEDDSVTTLPRAPKTPEDRLFTHVIDEATGLFRSMKVNANADGSGSVETMGETIFDPKSERIINVAYPQRNEVVQSPSSILGDDSILLKYLNPHICVVVTEATVQTIENAERREDELYKALESARAMKDNNGKNKPVGATNPGDPAPKQVIATPTLFINLMDTVSGQILHRASHAHASLVTKSSGATTNVPVVVSENWVIYAFTNQKSRRTELGVLTLHEGMIDKHGITAFHTPEQQLTFSSLVGEKPIVLAKTFAVNLPVSAIGVTNTKGGISSKNIIVTTGVKGNVIKIDRRLLDPRRPFGEPKVGEKKEGLLQ